MCKTAIIQSFLRAHCKLKGRSRQSMKRRLYEAGRQGKALESSVSSGKKEMKINKY